MSEPLEVYRIARETLNQINHIKMMVSLSGNENDKKIADEAQELVIVLALRSYAMQCMKELELELDDGQDRGSDANEFEFVFLHETEHAILVSENSYEQGFWLPKSQVTYDDERKYLRYEKIVVGVPSWLLKNIGLAE